MIARVRGVIAASICAGSIVSVSGSTSTSTGRAPTCSMTLTVEANVSVVVITSSPGPIPLTDSAVCRPAVQELSARAPGAESAAANSASKRATLGPVVSQSERSVSATSAISSSPMSGGANGRYPFRRLELAPAGPRRTRGVSCGCADTVRSGPIALTRAPPRAPSGGRRRAAPRQTTPKSASTRP